MENYNKQEKIKGRIKFISMSIIGIILFLIPIPNVQDGEKQTTLPVAFLANWLKDLLGLQCQFSLLQSLRYRLF